MSDGFAEALEIPAEEEIDHSEELVADDEPVAGAEPGTEAAESDAIDPISEPESTQEASEESAEGSDTGETDPEAHKAPEPSLGDVISQLEEMKKANAGLYSDLKAKRESERQAREMLEQLQKRADEEKATKEAAEKAQSLPDKDEDPAGYLAAQQEQLKESIDQQFAQMEEARKQQEQAQMQQQVVATVVSDEDRFRQEKPDYDAALNYARDERARLLRATHPDQTDEWINAQIQRGDQMFAIQQLQNGVSPAHAAYEYAVRLGYQTGQSDGSGDGGQPAPAAAPAPEPAPAQPAPVGKPKMTSLSAVSGKSGGGRGRKVTWDEYANLDMDRHDHRALFDKISMDPSAAQAIERDGHIFL